MELSQDLVVQNKNKIIDRSMAGASSILIKDNDTDQFDWIVWGNNSYYSNRYMDNTVILDISEGAINQSGIVTYLTKDGKVLQSHNWYKKAYLNALNGNYGISGEENDVKSLGAYYWSTYRGEGLRLGYAGVKYVYSNSDGWRGYKYDDYRSLSLVDHVDGSTYEKTVRSIFGHDWGVHILMENGALYSTGYYSQTQQISPWYPPENKNDPLNWCKPELRSGVKTVFTGSRWGGSLALKDNGTIYPIVYSGYTPGIVANLDQLNNGDFGKIVGVYCQGNYGYIIHTDEGSVIPTAYLRWSYYGGIYSSNGTRNIEMTSLKNISYIVTNYTSFVMVDSDGKLYSNSSPLYSWAHSKYNPYERICDISGITDIFSTYDSFAAFKRDDSNKLVYVDSWPSYWVYSWNTLMKDENNSTKYIRRSKIFYDHFRSEPDIDPSVQVDSWKYGIDKVCSVGGYGAAHYYLFKEDDQLNDPPTYKLVHAWGAIHGANDQHLYNNAIGNARWAKLNGGGIKSIHSTEDVILFLFNDDRTIMTNGGNVWWGEKGWKGQIPPDVPSNWKTSSSWRADTAWQQGLEKTFTFDVNGPSIVSITSRNAAFTILFSDGSVKEIGTPSGGCSRSYSQYGVLYDDDSLYIGKTFSGYKQRSSYNESIYPNIHSDGNTPNLSVGMNIKTNILDQQFTNRNIYNSFKRETNCDINGNNIGLYDPFVQNSNKMLFPKVRMNSDNINFVAENGETISNHINDMNKIIKIKLSLSDDMRLPSDSDFNTNYMNYLEFTNCSIVTGTVLEDNTPDDAPPLSGPWELTVKGNTGLSGEIINYSVKIASNQFDIIVGQETVSNLSSEIKWSMDNKCKPITFTMFLDFLKTSGYCIIYIDFNETITNLEWDDLEFINCNSNETSFLRPYPWYKQFFNASWRKTYNADSDEWITSKYMYVFPNSVEYPWQSTNMNITLPDEEGNIQNWSGRTQYARWYSDQFQNDFTANVKVSANKYTDLAGNTNTESSEIDIQFNALLLPSISVTATSIDGQTNIDNDGVTNISDILVTIVFDAAVSSFDQADIILDNLRGIHDWTQSSDKKTYTFKVETITNGQCMIEVGLGRTHDSNQGSWYISEDKSWNYNYRITDLDQIPRLSYIYDGIPPILTIMSHDVEDKTYTNSSPINFNFTFNEPVFNFTIDDIILTPSLGGNFTNLTTDDNIIFNTVFTPNGGGEYKIEVNSNTFNDEALNDNIQSATFEWTQVIQSNCFVKGTIVKTDQGNVEIQTIDSKRHTINKKRIKHLTGTFSPEKKIVCVKKHAFGKNKPNKDTKMSGSHKILYDGCLIEARKLVNVNNKIKLIDYNNECLYNILMEKPEIMYVHNIPVETLHPENTHAKLCNSSLHPKHLYDITKRLNKAILTKNKEEYITAEYELRHPETIESKVIMAYTQHHDM